MIASFSWADWARLAAAVIWFNGLGYAVVGFLPIRFRLARASLTALVLSLTMCVWSLALAWLAPLGIRVTTVSLFGICGIGWAVGLARQQPWRRWRQIRRIGLAEGLLWLSLVATVVTGLWAVRQEVTGLGSDSYHHTLIANMILSQGRLPDNFQPYAPTLTFTYHYAFHALVAALAMLAGLKPVSLVLAAGQGLMAAAALSAAFFTQITTRSWRAAAISAVVAGLISVFPAFFVNWGRYPQLAGLMLLPVFMALIWRGLEADRLRELSLPLGILAAGLSLAHYRVTLMALSGVLVWVLAAAVRRRWGWSQWRGPGFSLVAAGGIAAALTLPWWMRLLAARQIGFPAGVSSVTPAAFSLERLGPDVVAYPTNLAVLGLALAAAVWGLWRREPLIIGLLLWVVTMLAASGPWLAGALMDTVSVFIALYFPVAVAIGWALDRALTKLGEGRPVIRWAGIGLGLWVVGQGVFSLSAIVQPWARSVTVEDLRAMEYIRANTPADARFMMNTWHFEFLPELIIGTDAGQWIPLLAERQTVAPPLAALSERFPQPGYAGRAAALDQLNGHLTSAEALSRLAAAGVTHVYVGQSAGPIQSDELLKSPAFHLEYQDEARAVFAFLGPPR